MPYEYVRAGASLPLNFLGNLRSDADSETPSSAAPNENALPIEPFYVHYREALLFWGAVAFGVGYWLWKKKEAAGEADLSPMTQNDGYYNLPEPKTPRRPSGL